MSYLVKFIPIIFLLNFSFTELVYAKKDSKPVYKSKQLQVSLSPRKPEQMAAFYEGRGFSKEMINLLKQQCFITVGIHNKSNDIIWHDLSNWTFQTAGKTINDYERSHWKQLWKKMKIPMAHQSTFRWTLLPPELDFRPNEHEGGNIIFPYTETEILLTAEFRTKSDKTGKPIKITINNIFCAK